VSIRDLADTWSSLYSNSAALRSTLAFAHIGALVGSGGCAIAADRGALRAFARGRAAFDAELDNLRGIHRIVIGGLALVIASGVLLMLADVDAYVANRIFWLKMALVVALLANGALVMRAAGLAESGDADGARLLRVGAIVSVALWFATTLAGAVLPNVL
jgi:hypothetical protein